MISEVVGIVAQPRPHVYAAVRFDERRIYDDILALHKLRNFKPLKQVIDYPLQTLLLSRNNASSNVILL
jgi:hypothetical protein